jgi:hypothetical protein
MIILMRKVVATAKQNKLKIIAVDWQEIRALAPKEVSEQGPGRVGDDRDGYGRLRAYDVQDQA